MSETANPALEQIEVVFKDAVWDNMVTAALAALFVQVPGLRFWPLKQIITWAVNRYSEQLFDGLKLMVDLKAISFINEKNRKDFETVSVTLKIVAKNHGIDSEQFRKAREDAKKSLSRFVRVGA